MNRIILLSCLICMVSVTCLFAQQTAFVITSIEAMNSQSVRLHWQAFMKDGHRYREYTEPPACRVIVRRGNVNVVDSVMNNGDTSLVIPNLQAQMTYACTVEGTSEDVTGRADSLQFELRSNNGDTEVVVTERENIKLQFVPLGFADQEQDSVRIGWNAYLEWGEGKYSIYTGNPICRVTVAHNQSSDPTTAITDAISMVIPARLGSYTCSISTIETARFEQEPSQSVAFSLKQDWRVWERFSRLQFLVGFSDGIEELQVKLSQTAKEAPVAFGIFTLLFLIILFGLIISVMFLIKFWCYPSYKMSEIKQNMEELRGSDCDWEALLRKIKSQATVDLRILYLGLKHFERHPLFLPDGSGLDPGYLDSARRHHFTKVERISRAMSGQIYYEYSRLSKLNFGRPGSTQKAKDETKTIESIELGSSLLQKVSAWFCGQLRIIVTAIATYLPGGLKRTRLSGGLLSSLFSLDFIWNFGVAAPLLGLLGTVHGMARSFGSIPSFSNGDLMRRLSVGINEALYTTIGGLLIGLFMLLMYYLISWRIEVRREAWQQMAEAFMARILKQLKAEVDENGEATETVGMGATSS